MEDAVLVKLHVVGDAADADIGSGVGRAFQRQRDGIVEVDARVEV